MQHVLLVSNQLASARFGDRRRLRLLKLWWLKMLPINKRQVWQPQVIEGIKDFIHGGFQSIGVTKDWRL
jgi:hypothetical protein